VHAGLTSFQKFLNIFFSKHSQKIALINLYSSKAKQVKAGLYILTRHVSLNCCASALLQRTY
jgi:hypothetical protein